MPTSAHDPKTARPRLLQLVRERAFRDGIDITLASGKRSDFYINGKTISLHAEGLWLAANLMLDQLDQFPRVVAIGGLTLGADPLAGAMCALSWQRGRPLDAFIVRKEAKGHGTGSRIEGEVPSADRGQVAILEDTVTTGGSARQAIDAVRAEAGADVAVVLALADRLDPDSAPFRAEFDLRPLFDVQQIRGQAH
jgi:orotate phosphoribosyltransferase